MLLFVTIQPHPLNGVLLSLLVSLELVCVYMEKVLSLLIKYVVKCMQSTLYDNLYLGYSTKLYRV